MTKEERRKKEERKKERKKEERNRETTVSYAFQHTRHKLWS